MQKPGAHPLFDRRRFLQSTGAFVGLSALGFSGCDHKPVKASAPALPFYDALKPIVPIRADEDRIFRITVCTRPFRAAGPRLEVEKINDRAIIHNYGHGGSGWSLSWGYAKRVAAMAAEVSPADREVAVVGAGALGLTSAIMLQRAGFKVTIYARELAPYTRSSRATGTWTPDSRIAFSTDAPADFATNWEHIARDSFFYHQSMLGAAGSPIEWIDQYDLEDERRTAPPSPQSAEKPHHPWLHLYSRIADLEPAPKKMPRGATPFPTDNVWQTSTLMFNVAVLSRQLLNDFFTAGGRYERRYFQSAQQIAALPQRVIVNCPGYEARKLWADNTITPVRGQIQWLIPQEDARYSLLYNGLVMVARRDGIVLQMYKSSEDGWNIEDETIDRAEAHEAVATLQQLYGRMGKTSTPKV